MMLHAGFCCSRDSSIQVCDIGMRYRYVYVTRGPFARDKAETTFGGDNLQAAYPKNFHINTSKNTLGTTPGIITPTFCHQKFL